MKHRVRRFDWLGATVAWRLRRVWHRLVGHPGELVDRTVRGDGVSEHLSCRGCGAHWTERWAQ